VLDRTKVQWAGKRSVHQERQALFLRHIGYRPEIDDPKEWVGGSLDEDGPGRLPNGFAPVSGLLGIDVGDLDPEARQLVVEEMLRAAVDPGAGDQMIAGAKYSQMGQGRGAHAAGDEDGVLRSFEQGVLAGDLQLSGVVSVPAVQHLLLTPNRIQKGAALLQGGRDGSPVGAALRDAVDSEGREAELPAHAVGTG